MKVRVLILSIGLALFGANAFADTYVQGYFKKDGTYVAPHYRSNPNHTKYDNWSTEGNYNPYTGERGSRRVCGTTYNSYYC